MIYFYLSAWIKSNSALSNTSFSSNSSKAFSSSSRSLIYYLIVTALDAFLIYVLYCFILKSLLDDKLKADTVRLLLTFLFSGLSNVWGSGVTKVGTYLRLYLCYFIDSVRDRVYSPSSAYTRPWARAIVLSIKFLNEGRLWSFLSFFTGAVRVKLGDS